ncbi:MAG: helix-turn-helix domain-containing protein [Firmicutes bacterium]|nr:helix-turn-helix domain-containing protein [Bacillota bacterium]
MKIFAERLKDLRAEKSLSCQGLGKAIEVSAAAICRWENAMHDIKGEDLVKLAKFFEVTTDYLLGLADY